MSISPHADWNGTAGTGYSDNGGGGSAIPSDPTRTTFKPACHWMQPDIQERFSGEFWLEVSAFCEGGISGVTFHCEGVSETVTEISRMEDGNFGYRCLIDTSEELTDGGLSCYAVVTPSDEDAQVRVLGPITIWSDTNSSLTNSGTIVYMDTRYDVSVSGVSGTFTRGDVITWSNDGGGTGRVWEWNGSDTLVLCKLVKAHAAPADGATLAVAATGAGATISGAPTAYGSNLNDGSISTPKQFMDGGTIAGTDWSGITIYMRQGYHPPAIRTDSGTPRVATSGAIIVTRDPATTSSRSDVWIGTSATTSTRTEPNYIIFRDISMLQRLVVWEDTSPSGHYLFDGCYMLGDGTVASIINNGQTGYFKDCTVSQWASQAPWYNHLYVRNSSTDGGNGDVLTGVQAAFGVAILDGGFIEGQHPDVLQIEGGGNEENKIFCNVQAKGQQGQGIFLTRTLAGLAIKDVALVNFLVDASQGGINWPADHLMLYHVSIISSTDWTMGEDLTMVALPVTSLTGSFSTGTGDGWTALGSESEFTGSVPKNAPVSSGGTLYLSELTGTPLLGETVTEEPSGDGTAVVAGDPAFIANKGYNAALNSYFKKHSANGSGTELFVEEDWTYDSNAFDDATWNPGSNVFSVDNPFTNAGSLDYTPSGMPLAPRLSQVPYDAEGNPRGSLTAVGALDYTFTAPLPSNTRTEALVPML